MTQNNLETDMTQTPPLHLGRALDLLDEEMPRWLKSFNLRI